MTVQAAIVIPVYRPYLTWYEEIAFRQAERIFARHPMILIAPETLDTSFVSEKSKYKTVRLPEIFFKDIDGYNALMLTPEFYQIFRSYRYILIYQLDAFAFSDQLERFCAMGYDYIGAPWPFHCGPDVLGKDVFLHVGNGGFSLRRVEACIGLLRKQANLVKEWMLSEDTFFAYCGKYCSSPFRVAPVNIAYQFSWEFYPQRCARKNKGYLPFGCHAWHRRDADFYVKAFAAAGCDISSHRKEMESRDLVSKTVQLRRVAYQRLIRRLQHRQPVSHYLPRGSRWEVFVVGKDNLPLIGRFQEEKVPMASAHFFEVDQLDELLCALRANQRYNSLIVRIQDDDLLIELQKNGLTCGREYQSFWQSYVVHCGRMLRRMVHSQGVGE